MSDFPAKVSPAHIERLLDNAEFQRFVAHGKDTIISFRLPDRANFTVCGRSSVVSPEEFTESEGDKWAKEKAKTTLWQLEGYLLQLLKAGLIVEAEGVKLFED